MKSVNIRRPDDIVHTVKSFKLTGLSVLPVDLDFNLFGLHKEEIINNKGSLVQVNYWKNFDGVSYSDLIVQDNYEYVINSSDLVVSRVETINWYYEDGLVGCTKSILKYYNLSDAINEGIRRRGTIINKAKVYGLIYISGMHVSGMPNSYYFLLLCLNEINLYLNGVKAPLVAFIDSITESYITEEVRAGFRSIIVY